MHPLFAAIITSVFYTVTRLIPVPILTKISPQWSISFNLKLVQLRWNLPFPNYDTAFQPLRENNNVRWMFEIEDRQLEDPVLVFLHGGGYSFGIFPPFLNMLLVLYQMMGGPTTTRLSILVLDYSISSPFPTQLNELIQVYSALQQTCSNVILLGDSAGAHLALSLIRHSQQPLPSVSPVDVGDELKHLVMLSPWVNLWPQFIPGSSYDLFHSSDILNLNILNSMRERFYTEDVDDNGDDSVKIFIDMMNWPSDIKLPKTFICVGAKECMRDDILEFAQRVNIEPFVEMDHGTHDSACFWPNEIMGEVSKFLR